MIYWTSCCWHAMLCEFFRSQKLHIRFFAYAGVFAFVGQQVYSTVLSLALNRWSQRFFDGLSANDPNVVAGLLTEFVVLVTPAIVVHPVLSLVRSLWLLAWRLELMRAYLNRWSEHSSAIEGASQRVQEDTARFSSGIERCVSQVVGAVLSLVVFAPTLLDAGSSLFTSCSAAALGGLCVSVVIGYPLIQYEVDIQVVEAEVRKRLVMAEEDVTRVNNVFPTLDPLKHVVIRLSFAFLAFNLWSSLFDQAASLLPYALLTDRLTGDDRLSAGEVLRLVGVFSHVFNAMSVVSSNWAAVNEFRSVLRRLRTFEATLSPASCRTARALPLEISTELTIH